VATPEPPAVKGQGDARPKVSGLSYADRLVNLMEAAEKGRVSLVHEAIKAGADPNDKDDEGRTALMKGAAAGHEAVVVALLTKGALVNEKDGRGQTALMRAAEKGNTTVVKFLVAPSSVLQAPQEILKAAGLDAKPVGGLGNLSLGETAIDAKDARGETALLKACRAGHPDVVEVLLRSNSKYMTRHKDGETALMAAAAAGHTDVVRVLVETAAYRPEPLAQIDAKGRTALQIAAAAGNAEIVGQLLPDRFWHEVQIRDSNPVVVLTEERKTQYVEYLNHKDRDGKTALQAAKDARHGEVVALLQKAGVKE
jgi:ankyrin repeat protein